ncbi:MAG: Uma2 family endonuclease [bacterium]
MVHVPYEKDGATYADLEALPSNLVGEIVSGRLIASPRPAPRHAQASSGLGVLVGAPFHFGRDGPGGWWILDEPELHLGQDVLVPDLAGWRRERLPRMPETAYFELVPDWVCEVISPSTERLDRGEKLEIYRREQVAHVWLVSPLARTVEVLRLTGEGFLLAVVHAVPGPVRAEPFDAVELDLGLLFDEPAEPDDPNEPDDPPGGRG